MFFIKCCLFSGSFYWQQSTRRQIFWHCETEFKTRLGNHENSFKNRRKEKDTEHSRYIWDLKDKNITNYSIKWSIVKQTSAYNSVTNSCNLCLLEKLVICNFTDKDRLINKLMDLVSKCRHENKLSNYKPQMFPLLLLYPEISSNCQSILYNKRLVKFMIFYNVIHKL